MSTIRIAWVADFHKGSPVGLTLNPLNKTQEKLLELYCQAICWFGDPPDYLFAIGDISEGIDRRWVSELQNPLIIDQMQGAGELLDLWKPKKETVITTGTAVHTTAQLQEMERIAAQHIQVNNPNHKVTVCRKINTSINGWFYTQARHYVGRSTIPHGRATAPLRSAVWQDLNSFLNSITTKEPARQTHLHVFGHVHYWGYAENNRGAVVTLPCWKALGDKFGDEICEGSVDLGVFKTEIGETEEEGWTWSRKLYRPGLVSRLERR